MPFFESYFSNFIEGTEFGVEEARKIAVDGEVPRTGRLTPTMSQPPTDWLPTPTTN